MDPKKRFPREDKSIRLMADINIPVRDDKKPSVRGAKVKQSNPVKAIPYISAQPNNHKKLGGEGREIDLARILARVETLSLFSNPYLPPKKR